MKLILNGCNGRMGKALASVASKESDVVILYGVDPNPDAGSNKYQFPVHPSLSCHDCNVDVIIDFSHPSALKHLLGWSILNRTPVVIATTGLGPEEHRIIQEASELIPVFQSENMSLGIHAICRVLETITPILGTNYDIELIEKHHKHKKDAPSGTTYLLTNAIGHHCPTHSIRSGTIPGEHTILFSGPDEIIEITHTAYSPEIFARGALAAAHFLILQKPGLYGMRDMDR